MGAREKVEKLIKKKEEEIVGLEKQINDTRIYIQALQDSIKLLPREYKNGVSIKLRPGSMCYRAYELLKNTGHPMHIKEIIEGIGMKVNKKARASLRGSLGPYLKEGRIFKVTAPATFGLIELDYEENQTEKKEAENEETTNLEPF